MHKFILVAELIWFATGQIYLQFEMASRALEPLHCIEGTVKATDLVTHEEVIKRKHFPRYWPFVRGIHRSPVNYPHKGQWCWVLMFSLIYAWINGWVNNREAGDCDAIALIMTSL